MTAEHCKPSSFRTIRTFLKVGTCSEAACNVLDRAFGRSLQAEEHAALPLAGGIIRHGYQCGLVWGATLAAGAQAFHELGAGARAEVAAVRAAQSLIGSFTIRFGDFNCLELSHTDWRKPGEVRKHLLRGGPVRCLWMAAKSAPLALRDIERSLSDGDVRPLPRPVSCAAMVVRKLGGSDLHTAIVAGFAGGIGLSGGACGALGAAIWLNALRTAEQTGGKIEFEDPGTLEILERFRTCADCEFECSAIVGRKFDSVEDHAGYLRDGGCAKIIDALIGER